jgi:hypothetical protein
MKNKKEGTKGGREGWRDGGRKEGTKKEHEVDCNSVVGASVKFPECLYCICTCILTAYLRGYL